MKSTRAFTIVEVLIVITVIAILAAITYLSYSGIRVAAERSVAQNNLKTVSTQMELAYVNDGTYPTTLPGNNEADGGGGNGNGNDSSNGGMSNMILKWSGKHAHYSSLTPVQNGVLLAQTCQDLINEGLGDGLNQAGATQHYITGCGNWNKGSAQITAWDTKVWNTPVKSEQLMNYANTFTTNDTWNASQASVVKNFYTQLVTQQLSQGGTFPVISFWDSWASPTNGGVMKEELPSMTSLKESYCIEVPVGGVNGEVWHVDETGMVQEGSC